MNISTIGAINLLPEPEKREIYCRVVPKSLIERFKLPALDGIRAQQLMKFKYAPKSSDVEFSLFHDTKFPDPILYGHLVDTMNGQLHILLYILNDPDSPRFNVDIMPDGSSTKFGTLKRNLAAEQSALEYGLAPGQVRRGLRMMGDAMHQFEIFVKNLGHDIYFVEPLYYHTAIIFERYGFTYQSGRKWMEQIHEDFSPGGKLRARLDGSSVFRKPQAADSIRLRSWAIQDGILDGPFTGVMMYKHVGKSTGVTTCAGCSW
jgi:hypothetical protein